MATLTATPPPSPANFYNDEPKIYISTATLQLKQNFDDYKWQTTVLTPQTPEAPAEMSPTPSPVTEMQEAEVYEPECQTTCQKQQQQQQQPPAAAAFPPPPSRVTQRWTPAELHGVPKTIYTIVGDFMSAERYDSQCNQLWSRENSEPISETTKM